MNYGHDTSGKAGLSAEPRDDDGWRDIASAPKDGTEVWVYSPTHGQLVARWEQVDGGGHPENGPSVYWWVADHSEFIDGPYDAPTHWRPLPAPPSQGAGR